MRPCYAGQHPTNNGQWSPWQQARLERAECSSCGYTDDRSCSGKSSIFRTTANRKKVGYSGKRALGGWARRKLFTAGPTPVSGGAMWLSHSQQHNSRSHVNKRLVRSNRSICTDICFSALHLALAVGVFPFLIRGLDRGLVAADRTTDIFGAVFSFARKAIKHKIFTINSVSHYSTRRLFRSHKFFWPVKREAVCVRRRRILAGFSLI